VDLGAFGHGEFQHQAVAALHFREDQPVIPGDFPAAVLHHQFQLILALERLEQRGLVADIERHFGGVRVVLTFKRFDFDTLQGDVLREAVVQRGEIFGGDCRAAGAAEQGVHGGGVVLRPGGKERVRHRGRFGHTGELDHRRGQRRGLGGLTGGLPALGRGGSRGGGRLAAGGENENQ